MDSSVREVVCPHCDEPMLTSWGATCGLCRPAVAAPSGAGLLSTGTGPLPALGLGWLVVLEGPERTRIGTMVPLVSPTLVLTRDDGRGGATGELAFRDDFMSAGHAVLRRVRRTDEASFTLEDRKSPGPSSNGTYVNARRLGEGEAVALLDGDTLVVGTTELLFRALTLPPVLR